MKRLRRFLVAGAALLLAPASAPASSFVGNGGNAGDVELRVTLNQIRDALADVNADTPEDDLCICLSGLDAHAACDVLQGLTPDQQKTCSSFLKKRAQQIMNLASPDGIVRYTWTSEAIHVTEKNGPRAADAVALPAQNLVTINQSRFVTMANHERLLLITHELGHLTKEDGKHPVDDEPVGGFTSPEGGRELLNAAAASVVQMAYARGIYEKYSGTLTLSQGVKRNWIFLASGSTSAAEQDSFGVTKFQGSKFGYRHQFGALGAIVQYRSAEGSMSLRNTIHGDEKLKAWGAGVSYRYFPSDDPLTFWGQSHLVGTFMVERLSTEYHLKDDFIDERETAVSTSWTAGLSYFMPLKRDFWIYLQYEYLPHKYSYETLAVESGNIQSSYAVGVAYAF